MKKRRIGVIGGGLAGTTAAFELRKAGYEPLLLEAQSVLGGRTRSVVRDGVVYDSGAWSFTSRGKVFQVSRQLGLSDRLVHMPMTIGRFIDGSLTKADMKNPLSLVGPVISSRELFSALVLMRWALRPPGALADEMAQKWAERHFGAGFCRDVLSPVAALFFLQGLETLSRDSLLSTIGYLGRIRLFCFREGMSELCDALGGRVSVKTGLRVDKIVLDRGRVWLEAGEFCQWMDGVVVAAALPEALRLLKPHIPDRYWSRIHGWPHASTIVAGFLLRGQWPDKALCVIPPRASSGLISGLTMERAKCPDRVPEGHDAITVYARPQKVAWLSEKSDHEITQLFLNQLEGWMPGIEKRVKHWWVGRWPYGVSHCGPDGPARVAFLKKVLGNLENRFPIWVAGDYLGGSSLEAALESGIDAARKCRAYFSCKDNTNRLFCT